MARFYASIQGSRGEATRTGSKDSGMRGHIRGWNVGVSVYMEPRTEPDSLKETDRDCGQIMLTSGSNGGRTDKGIARFRETAEGVLVILYDKDSKVLTKYLID